MFNLKAWSDHVEMKLKELEIILKSKTLIKKLDEKFNQLKKEDLIAAKNFLDAIQVTMLSHSKKRTEESGKIVDKLCAWFKPTIADFFKSDRTEYLKAMLWVETVEEVLKRTWSLKK